MRRYGNDLSASTFSLAFQELPEHPPGCIGDGKGQTMVAHHVGRFQVFYDERLVAIDVATGGFVQRVFALVGDSLVDTSNQSLRLLASGAARSALCQLALCAPQFLGALFRVPGILNDLPTAISNQVADTHIKPNGRVLFREWHRLGLTDALDIPAGGAQHETGKLEGSLQRAMHDHTNTSTADSRRFEASIVQAVSRITKLDRIDHDGGQIRVRLFAVTLVLLVEMQVRARLLVVRDQLFQAGIIHLA